MNLSAVKTNKKFILTQNQLLQRLIPKGAVCYVLKKFKTYLVLEVVGGGIFALDNLTCNSVEVEYV